MGLIEHIVVEYFWIVGTILVPISLTYDVFMWFFGGFENIVRWLNKTNQTHEQKVEDIQRQVREWKASGSKKQMCTAHPCWKSITLQETTYKTRMHQIKIDLDEIILIDTENKIVRVEPSATIGQLNDALIKKGWMCAVVMI